MKYTYRFDQSETLNSVVPNYEKLNIEIRSTVIEEYDKVYPHKGYIYVDFNIEPTLAHLAELKTVIGNHDGKVADVSLEKINARTTAFNTMVQMAHYHPLLDPVETNDYLRSIDNYKNAFLTDGITDNIIARILSDAASGDFETYLGQVVNEAGNTTAEYLISSIMEINV